MDVFVPFPDNVQFVRKDKYGREEERERVPSVPIRLQPPVLIRPLHQDRQAAHPRPPIGEVSEIGVVPRGNTYHRARSLLECQRDNFFSISEF